MADTPEKESLDNNIATDNLLLEVWAEEVTEHIFEDSFSELPDLYQLEPPVQYSSSQQQTAPRRNVDVCNMKVAFWLLVALIFGSCLFQTVREVFSKSTILPPSAPRPFFSNASRKYVDDYYTGNMRVERFLQNSRISIVMYYAPWDRFSDKMRHPFELTARLMTNEKSVHFAAINCFAATGECRQIYKMYSYPVIVAYVNKAHVMYQGEHASDHLFRWVETLMHPIEYIHDTDKFFDFALKYDYAVIWHAPKETLESSPYRRYLAAAFQSHIGRPEGEAVAFGVITSRALANSFAMQPLGSVILITSSGERLAYHQKFTAESLIEWVKDKRTAAHSLHWLSFNKNTDLKNTQLADLLNQTALMVLLTGSQPLYQEQPEISMFKELALEYWQCGAQASRMAEVFSPTVETYKRYRNNRINQTIEDNNACENAVVTGKEVLACCEAAFSDNEINDLCANPPTLAWDEGVCRNGECGDIKDPTESVRQSHWSGTRRISNEACSSVIKVPPGDILKRCCSERDRSLSNPTTNPFLITDERLRREKADILRCNKARLASHLRYDQNDRYDTTEPIRVVNNTNILAGIGCRTNDSMRFAVLDSRHYGHLVQKWGLPRDGEARVVAIDSSRELFTVMEDTINPTNLRQFAIDYHQHVLNDFMLSEESTLSRFSVDYSKAQSRSGNVFIPKLTQRNFSLIANGNLPGHPDSLVFFSGGSWHGPSASLVYVFQTVASYFLPQHEKSIRFYMIDTSRNELPYNYNFDRLPTVVFFNGNRSDQTWMFPPELSFNVPNLYSFILTHASLELKWRISFEICDEVCRRRNLRRLRRHNLTLQRGIRRMREQNKSSSFPQSYYIEQTIQRRIAQLRCVRAVLAVLNSLGKSQHDVAAAKLDSLLERDSLLKYMVLANVPSLQ